MGSTGFKVTLAATLFLGLSLPVCWSQDQSQGTAADGTAIKQTIADFYQSFSRHDAHATAMAFAEDGDFTNMLGVHRHGRKEIQERFAGLYAGTLKNAHRTDTVRSIRFFTPQVASVDADTVITGTLAADGSVVPLRKGLMTVLMTKQDGRWLISVFHEAEYPRPDSPAASPAK